MAAVERQERQQIEERDRERDQAEHPEEAVRALLRRVGGALDDPDGARDLLAALARDDLPSEATMSLRDEPSPRADSRAAAGGGKPVPAEDEAEPVDALVALGGRAGRA